MVTVEEVRKAMRAEGPATVMAIGTANPPFCVDQSTYPDYYFRITNSEHKVELKEKFQRMCDKSMIKKRYMYLTEEILKENPNLCAYMAPSLDARQDMVVVEIPKLGKEAAVKAIKEWGQPKSKITHMVFCTTSGVDMPGADYQLTKLLGLRPSVKRLMMYQQGCFAGGMVLRLAKDLAENNKGARVLVVCSEITAVTFRGPSDTHLDSLVGQALFGDGASAIIVGADPIPEEKPLFEIVSAAQTILPDSEGAIDGHLREVGLTFHLLKDVPGLISKNIEKSLVEAFKPLGISDWNSLFWIAHPGGPAILDQVEEKLALKPEKLKATRHVLSEYGNMSSACVLFILDEMRKKSLENGHKTTGEGLDWGVLFGFGPGLEEEDSFSDASLELFPMPNIENNVSTKSLPVISINAGSLEGATTFDKVNFQEDICFTGGDTLRTETKIGDGEGLLLYQTARFGNFSYWLKTLERGNYIIDLHLAEIVFTDGPPGMRVFDVYIQEQKVVSGIDIYARVGANKPLVISNLKAFVNADEELSIRFEGVTGNPLVCGISVRKDLSASFGEVELIKDTEMSQITETKPPKDTGECAVGQIEKLQVEYECQKRELNETRRALEKLKRENESKSRECQEAWRSLKDLQNELMRKSMHVGSLAFAIEGQVTEKSRWFSSMRDLQRKLKLLKMDQTKLSEEALSYQKCLADMNDMSSIIQSKLNEQVESHNDIKNKFIKGAKEQKELYNKILELKGNIRVFCRCRPLNTDEIAAGASIAMDFEAAKDGELTVTSNGAPKKTFKFDAVFGPRSNQVDVFQDTAPFAASVLDGYNVCIFAYGQTGTGKTFTMEGTNGARGVNFRTLEELFRIIKEREREFQYEISVSVLEVYNEQIRDLLVPGTQTGGTTKRLEIRQVGDAIHHVPGLIEAHVNNMSEVWEVLQTGSNARAVGSTNANEHSSRSHCIHCVMVKGENLLNGECTRSKLWLVDLAGSERVAKTEVQGERLKETQSINRSLSALGDVISALATKSPHIPFRNSKLTHLLQDSLGGDSKTLMFVQISPNENDLSETLCSLNFASRVRGIELGPAKKQADTTELLKYKQLAEKTKLDGKSKDVQIKKMEETISGLDVKLKEKDTKNKLLQDKIKELESQLLIERRLARQHVDSKILEQQQQQQLMRQQQQEEGNSALSRPPLANRPLGVLKNFNEGKEQTVNHHRPFSELNSYKLPPTPPPTDAIFKHIDPMEKENNPEIADQLLVVPKRTGRASLCPIAQRVLPAPAPRRASLIPSPSAVGSTKFPQPFLHLPPIQDNKKEETDIEAKCYPEPMNWGGNSPKEQKSGGRKLINSILRRSVQKRIQIRSPMQQHIRRGGGVNVGMEKVRVSIGGRGRPAHRLLLGNARRAMKDVQQQKESQREKERGWNNRIL